ncbi:MAG: FAD-binding protein [Muribaculum sp.]|nr:FAD-binding protein [Muribaculum sp.]
MNRENSITHFGSLEIKGEIKYDLSHKIMYATDASAYEERPSGVAYPLNGDDLVKIIRHAAEKNANLIPRATGTSLAGQVVGQGLIVDISKHFNRIIEINADQKWVRVQPGVVLDELNLALRPYGLIFGPETSTSNRCCVGGMVGNNSCGSHSLVFGNTRDNLLEAKVILSDGSRAHFKAMSPAEVKAKCSEATLEGRIYAGITGLLSDQENRKVIFDNFPPQEVSRRNTGYALDELARANCFDSGIKQNFNLCKILAGSEGTLAFIEELKLKIVPLLPKHKGVICVHCHTLEEAFDANIIALKHNPSAVELIDDNILQLSKGNIEQSKNRDFVVGEPAALVVVEFDEDSEELLDQRCKEVIQSLKAGSIGYAFPIIKGKAIDKIWNLRKAGLGLLSGMPGSKKPVAVIEDSAIAPSRLKDFHRELKQKLDALSLSAVYYAHIGSGELHLRPILNLKLEKDRKLFHEVGRINAELVRKYRGSLSGEHGDGRLRGEFIPVVLGKEIYNMLYDVKFLFDPKGIFNRHKIVDTPRMNTHLRAKPSLSDIMPTYFDYSALKGWLCAIEQCNGTGACRKSQMFGGVMCPSFKATRDEAHCTRARANLLRELIIKPAHKKVFSQPEILEALDTCLSCKGCKAECPSNVDMTRWKSEYLQHHYDESGTPFAVRMYSMLPMIQRIGLIAPNIYNSFVHSPFTSRIIKKLMGFAPERDIPGIYSHTLKKGLLRLEKHMIRKNEYDDTKRPLVYIFADEFTNFEDVPVGLDFAQLLMALGYEVRTAPCGDSGRIDLSKGLLKKARKQARGNVLALKDIISKETPLVGIEPSCILSFRDEYPDLVGDDLKDAALALANNALLYDEFICREIDEGRIHSGQFTDAPCEILLHGHCHQKALASVENSKRMLSLPRNYHCEIIPSGCCGMAGSFGYEKIHYKLSMKVGEEVLFPTIRNNPEITISAPGTSCRHQIKDGTGRTAYHPITLLRHALL